MRCHWTKGSEATSHAGNAETSLVNIAGAICGIAIAWCDCSIGPA
jgi:hypothetical protein